MTANAWCGLLTPVGPLTLIAGDDGLQAILWPLPAGPAFQPRDSAREDASHPVLTAAVEQLANYFAGSRTSFDLPLAPRGTEFQLRAWQALREIPFGEVRTYAEQAARIGRPNATRAIGGANSRNPLPIVVPCHRVVGASGALTGFAGGIEVKRWLLAHERAHRVPPTGATIPLWRDV